MPYKIISLQAENFQRLTAVEIRPDSNVVVIGGENEAGKPAQTEDETEEGV